MAMKILLLAAAMTLTAAHAADCTVRSGANMNALVELYTSEGCSSCPPADAHLTKLLREQPIAGVEVVPLSFHVDYWNHQGWRDPFSAKAFSVRQESYSKIAGGNKVYTPQMVVDGQDEFNGSDEGAARKFLQAAAARPHLALRSRFAPS